LVVDAVQSLDQVHQAIRQGVEQFMQTQLERTS
jgi:hypothetical protein